MKSARLRIRGHLRGRAPQGARGLKFGSILAANTQIQSRPARGAWVEITENPHVLQVSGGRAPQGARGLKLLKIRTFYRSPAVAPRKGRVG